MICPTCDYFIMFFSSFFSVFLLGLQSKNVMHSRYTAAIITSFGISVAQFTFIKFVAVGSSTTFLICALGGCAGISFSIWVYDNILKSKTAKKDE